MPSALNSGSLGDLLTARATDGDFVDNNLFQSTIRLLETTRNDNVFKSAQENFGTLRRSIHAGDERLSSELRLAKLEASWTY